MESINISKDITRFLEIKDIVVKYLIEKKFIDKEYDVQEFLNYIEIKDSIYTEKNYIIPFKIIGTDVERYLIYISNAPDEINKKFLHKLEYIKYDSSNLYSIPFENLYLSNKLDEPKFIINSKTLYTEG